MCNKTKIDKIKLRLNLAEGHLYNYSVLLTNCTPEEHIFFEEEISRLRKEISVLKWVLNVLETNN